MLNIPISKYIEIKQQKYIYLKLIPTKSIKNNQTYDILKLVNKMFINLNKQIKIQDKKLIIQTQMKASYYIYITKEKINFYFIVPEVFYSKFKIKFKEVWKSVQIEECNYIPHIENGLQYQLIYKKKDFLSSNADMRNNELLNANMTIMELLENQEEVGILYNFHPISEKQINYFKISCQKFIREYKENSIKYTNNQYFNIIIKCLDYMIEFINSTLNFIFNTKQVKKITPQKYSESTIRKSKSEMCKTQIVLNIKGKNQNHSKTLLEGLVNSYSEISDDNEFICKKVKNGNIKSLNTSIYECSNFISLPGDSLIKEYNNIEHNNIYDKSIPNCLKRGQVLLGNSLKNTNVYYSSDKECSRLGKVFIGGMGSGKTYSMIKLAKQIINKGDGLVVLDIIKNCELADSIKKITPKDKLIEIDCANIDQLQGFCFNELTYNKLDEYDKLAKCMEKANQLHILLNTINTDTKLTPRMVRYFYSACTIVFYSNFNASFREITRVLMYPKERKKALESLTERQLFLLQDEINNLKELDKENKNGTIENYDSKIDGIIDRVSILQTNLYTKLAFNKSADKNINFVEALSKNKVILIKAKESNFTNRSIRDLIATFFINKVWLSKQLNANTRTEIFIDEINLFPTAQNIFQDTLTECRKYNFIPTISLHFFNQCNKKCKEAILNSGMNFILLAGADIRNFYELETLFNKEGYDKIDFVNLKRYQALCLIRNEETVYSSFVVNM
jgi:hypothetical protein